MTFRNVHTFYVLKFPIFTFDFDSTTDVDSWQSTSVVHSFDEQCLLTGDHSFDGSVVSDCVCVALCYCSCAVTYILSSCLLQELFRRASHSRDPTYHCQHSTKLENRAGSNWFQHIYPTRYEAVAPDLGIEFYEDRQWSYQLMWSIKIVAVHSQHQKFLKNWGEISEELQDRSTCTAQQNRRELHCKAAHYMKEQFTQERQLSAIMFGGGVKLKSTKGVSSWWGPQLQM